MVRMDAVADAVSGGGSGALTQRAVPGLDARGTSAEAPESREIRGSTTIVELLRMFPDGEAARAPLAAPMPCAHCGGAFHEPLTMAAKRHRRDPRAVLEAFRALEHGGPSDAAGRGGARAGRLGRDGEPLRERGVERAGAERLVRDLDLGVAGRAHGRDDRVATPVGRRARASSSRGELDAPDVRRSAGRGARR